MGIKFVVVFSILFISAGLCGGGEGVTAVSGYRPPNDMVETQGTAEKRWKTVYTGAVDDGNGNAVTPGQMRTAYESSINNDHSALSLESRSAANQHPIGAIQGLTEVLAGKASATTATQTMDGLMSAADKIRLDGIAGGDIVDVDALADALAGYLPLGGGTLTGDLTVSGGKRIAFDGSYGNKLLFAGDAYSIGYASDGVIHRSDNRHKWYIGGELAGFWAANDFYIGDVPVATSIERNKLTTEILFTASQTWTTPKTGWYLISVTGAGGNASSEAGGGAGGTRAFLRYYQKDVECSVVVGAAPGGESRFIHGTSAGLAAGGGGTASGLAGGGGGGSGGDGGTPNGSSGGGYGGRQAAGLYVQVGSKGGDGINSGGGGGGYIVWNSNDTWTTVYGRGGSSNIPLPHSGNNYGRGGDAPDGAGKSGCVYIRY